MENMATWILAVSGVVSLVLTGALVWVTWRYVRLTGQLVDHNQRNSRREEVKQLAERRRMTVRLRSDVRRLLDTFEPMADSEIMPSSHLDLDALERQATQVLQAGIHLGGEIGSFCLKAEDALQRSILVSRKMEVFDDAKGLYLGEKYEPEEHFSREDAHYSALGEFRAAVNSLKQVEEECDMRLKRLAEIDGDGGNE